AFSLGVAAPKLCATSGPRSAGWADCSLTTTGCAVRPCLHKVPQPVPVARNEPPATSSADLNKGNPWHVPGLLALTVVAGALVWLHGQIAPLVAGVALRGAVDLVVLGGAALLVLCAGAAGFMDRRRRRIERERGALTSRYQAIFEQA